MVVSFIHIVNYTSNVKSILFTYFFIYSNINISVVIVISTCLVKCIFQYFKYFQSTFFCILKFNLYLVNVKLDEIIDPVYYTENS